MRMPIALALIVIGAILTIWGISASDSFASNVSEFFTGKPTDKTIWLVILGAGALIAGVATLALGRGKLSA